MDQPPPTCPMGVICRLPFRAGIGALAHLLDGAQPHLLVGRRRRRAPARDRGDRRSARRAPIASRSRNWGSCRSSSPRSNEPEARSVGHWPQRSATSRLQALEHQPHGAGEIVVLDRIGADADIAAQAVGVELAADVGHDAGAGHIAGRRQDRDLAGAELAVARRERLDLVGRQRVEPAAGGEQVQRGRALAQHDRMALVIVGGGQRIVGRVLHAASGSPTARAPPRRARAPNRRGRGPARGGR